MHLKWNDWTRFWGKKAAPQVPEWPSDCNFRKVTQNPQKEGNKGNFLKIAQEVALVWKAWKHRRKLHYPLIRMHFECKY